MGPIIVRSRRVESSLHGVSGRFTVVKSLRDRSWKPRTLLTRSWSTCQRRHKMSKGVANRLIFGLHFFFLFFKHLNAVCAHARLFLRVYSCAVKKISVTKEKRKRKYFFENSKISFPGFSKNISRTRVFHKLEFAISHTSLDSSQIYN